MNDFHPKRGTGPASLLMPPTNVIPCVGRVKTFHSWNESTIGAAEVSDVSGRVRGALFIGISRHDREDGVVIFADLADARATLKLIEDAIADVERIDRGVGPLAVAVGEPGSAVQ